MPNVATHDCGHFAFFSVTKSSESSEQSNSEEALVTMPDGKVVTHGGPSDDQPIEFAVRSSARTSRLEKAVAVRRSKLRAALTVANVRAAVSTKSSRRKPSAIRSSSIGRKIV